MDSRISYLISATELDCSSPSSQEEFLNHQNDYWETLQKVCPKENSANCYNLNSKERNRQLQEFSRIISRRLLLRSSLASFFKEFAKETLHGSTSVVEDFLQSPVLKLWIQSHQKLENELQEPTPCYNTSWLQRCQAQLNITGKKYLFSTLHAITILPDEMQTKTKTETLSDFLQRATTHIRAISNLQVLKQHIKHLSESPETTSRYSTLDLPKLPQTIQNFYIELSSQQWHLYNFLIQFLLDVLLNTNFQFSISEWEQPLHSLQLLTRLNPGESKESDVMHIPYLAQIQEQYEIDEQLLFSRNSSLSEQKKNVDFLYAAYSNLENNIERLSKTVRLILDTPEEQPVSSRRILTENNPIIERLTLVIKKMSSLRELYMILLRQYIRTNFDWWSIMYWGNIWNSIEIQKQLLLSWRRYLTSLPTENTESGITSLYLTENLLSCFEIMEKARNADTEKIQELSDEITIPIENIQKVYPYLPNNVLLLKHSPLSSENKREVRIQMIQKFFKDQDRDLFDVTSHTDKIQLIRQLCFETGDNLSDSLFLVLACEPRVREYFCIIAQFSPIHTYLKKPLCFDAKILQEFKTSLDEVKKLPFKTHPAFCLLKHMYEFMHAQNIFHQKLYQFMNGKMPPILEDTLDNTTNHPTQEGIEKQKTREESPDPLYTSLYTIVLSSRAVMSSRKTIEDITLLLEWDAVWTDHYTILLQWLSRKKRNPQQKKEGIQTWLNILKAHETRCQLYKTPLSKENVQTVTQSISKALGEIDAQLQNSIESQPHETKQRLELWKKALNIKNEQASVFLYASSQVKQPICVVIPSNNL
jgi:hypothetical protein